MVGNLPDLGVDAARSWFDGQELGDRKNARVCDTFNAAIPRELSPAQAVALMEDFAFKASGNGAVWYVAAIHNDHDANPHLHLMIRDRERDPAAGKKAQRVLMTTSRESTEHFRETWEKCANSALQLAGIDERIDRRSYAERGIDLVPTPHLGPSPTPQKIAYHAEVVAANNEFVQAQRELQEANEIVARVRQAIIAEQLLEAAKKPMKPPLAARVAARDDIDKVIEARQEWGQRASGTLLELDEDEGAIAIESGRRTATIVRVPITQQIRELVGHAISTVYDRVKGWVVDEKIHDVERQR